MTSPKSVSGIAVSLGVLDPKTQKIVLYHCNNGRAQEMLDTIAVVLFDKALEQREIPYPMGVKTKDLIERTEHAIKDVVVDYHKSGGVLTARGFFNPENLFQKILHVWHQRFAYPMKRTDSEWQKYPDEERINRLAISAQALRDYVKKRYKLEETADGFAYMIPLQEFEGFCKAASKITFDAFEYPDHMLHKMTHGVDPRNTE